MLCPRPAQLAQLASVLVLARLCHLVAGQSEGDDSSSFYLDALRDRTVDGTLRSVIAQVGSQGSPYPEVQLSSFLSLGCLQVSNLSAFDCEVSTQSSRLNCLSWCEEQQVDSRLAQTAFLRGTECTCCPSSSDLWDAASTEVACDQLCQDQENDIYGAPAFAGAARRAAACGGTREEVFSVFRQWDGMSPLGRRGALAVPFGVWYEVVLAQLSEKVATQDDLEFNNSNVQWKTYSNMKYFLHAAHVETGWPVFAHQMQLGFLPECLHYDGFRQEVVALARGSTGSVHVAVMCPSCSDDSRLVKVVDALNDTEAQRYELAMPACSFDPETQKLALVVVPRLENTTSSEKARILEVNLQQETVRWNASSHFQDALALENCRPMPEGDTVQPRGLTTLLAEADEGEFVLAEPAALVQLDGQELTRCSDGTTACAGAGLYPPLNLQDQDSNASKAGELSFLKPGEQLLLSINRFERKKNVGLAIRTLAELPSELFAKTKLVLAGGYDERLPENVEHAAELEALAKSLGVAEHVVQMRSVSATQKASLLRHAAALLYTPDREHFGIVPVEAMYARLPVVAVNTGGPLESIVENETGYLRPQDPKAWAECVAKLLRDTELRKRLGEAGRRRAREHFSLEAFGKILHGSVEQLDGDLSKKSKKSE